VLLRLLLAGSRMIRAGGMVQMKITVSGIQMAGSGSMMGKTLLIATILTQMVIF
jgi:hypothetical protein